MYNFDYIGVCSIAEEELASIEGGHDGTAYEIGHELGRAVAAVGVIWGLISGSVNRS
ncbi:hypothetical protein [Hymenobacter sediminis]|uniref:hypothetical protein n=1 Tax=Hymenobacter sediminis TaxID=2218621 RepID=UPI00138FF6CB|nr:hypothetical protein [Hymenobacter sediminis]